MCRSSSEPGGPRRCSADTRTAFRRSLHTVETLTGKQNALTAAAVYQTPAVPFTMPLPDGLESALAAARSAGTPLIVGGAVRDAALGVTPKDIDIEVHHTDIDTLAQSFRRNGFHVDEVGKQFGVLKISKPGAVSDLDVSVPRRDSKVAAGHRGFAVDLDNGMTVTEAAERRDYTVNALLYDPDRQILLDPFGGAADLQARTLRHVSDQFGDDPLRVLRGAQLAGRFAMTLHPDTARLCRGLLPQFHELATERVRDEWNKLYVKSIRPDLAVRALQDTGWDDSMPGLRSALADPRTTAAVTALPQLPAEDRMAVGAAIIATTMTGEHREDFLHRTVTGAAGARIAADLVDTASHPLDSTYARKHYAETMAKRHFTFDRYLTYCQALGDTSATRIAQAAISDGIGAGPETPMIQGRDVLAAAGSKKPGPWVGALVDAALDRQHRGRFTTRTEAVQWLTKQL